MAQKGAVECCARGPTASLHTYLQTGRQQEANQLQGAQHTDLPLSPSSFEEGATLC